MFRYLAHLFRRKALPTEPFIDSELGEFLFIKGIGWRKKVLLEGRFVNIYLGSDGENPSDEMRDTAKYWISNWESRRDELNQFMESELKTWPDEERRFAPQELKIRSIEILWADATTCMIYFDMNGMCHPQFHLTFNGVTPVGFAYDD